ncbi:MAG: BatD family protein [Rhodothermales bacterium]
MIDVRLAIFGMLAFVLTVPALAQDVAVRGSVSETTIGTQESVVFSVEIEGASLSDVRTPSPPDVSGLVLVQRTPSTHRSMTIINGRLQQSVSFRWTYRPQEAGPARIKAASVAVGDRTYSTEPISITVVDQSQRPNGRNARPQWPSAGSSTQESPDNAVERARDLFIRAVASTLEARLNEQVTIEYQLFFRDGVQLRQSRLAGSWDAEGFWREEFNVDSRPVPETRVENGIVYHMIVLKRVAVFPTRSGDLTIDPLEIETEAYVPSGASDAFDRFFSMRGRFESVSLSSPPVHLRVRPLPDNAPGSFSGAVGTYAVEAGIDESDVEVGEPVQLEVVVRGAGNLATLDAPRFQPPAIFERYDPGIETSIDRDGRRIRGSKTFRYVLVPRSNGTYELPPVTLTYFDPESGRYETSEAALPALRVTGSASPLAAGTTSGGLPIDDIAPIHAGAASWHAVDAPPLHRRAWPYAALALPIGLLLFLYAARRRESALTDDPRRARSRMAHPLAGKHLRSAQEHLADGRSRAFYKEIERAVTGFIGNRLHVAATGLTRNQIDALLVSVGVGRDDRTVLRNLLDECDRVRFAPLVPERETMEHAGERAAAVILAVDEAVKARRSEPASV